MCSLKHWHRGSGWVGVGSELLDPRTRMPPCRTEAQATASHGRESDFFPNAPTRRMSRPIPHGIMDAVPFKTCTDILRQSKFSVFCKVDFQLFLRCPDLENINVSKWKSWVKGSVQCKFNPCPFLLPPSLGPCWFLTHFFLYSSERWSQGISLF